MNNDRQEYEAVNHPPHYGGDGNKYEHTIVAEVWNMNGPLYCATKYVCRSGSTDIKPAYLKPGTDPIEDLEKGVWYTNRAISWKWRIRTGAWVPEEYNPVCVSKAWGLNMNLSNYMYMIYRGDLEAALEIIKVEVADRKAARAKNV